MKLFNKIKKKLQRKRTKEYYFKNGKIDPERTRWYSSPSSKYVLRIDSIETRKGSWSFTRGRVFCKDKLVFEVQRNYSSFPFTWVEGHPNGHDYLICGEDYQGQTFLELDTGNRKDFLPDEAKKGFGFCWVSHHPSPDKLTLAAEGCIWACPYEIRFYDFSDPMNWDGKELKIDSDEVYYCDEFGGWLTDDKVLISYSKDYYKPLNISMDDAFDLLDEEKITEEDFDNDDNEIKYTMESFTLQRDGLKMKVVEHFLDPSEKDRREKHKKANEIWEAGWKKYKETDPLYLKVKDRTDKAPFNSNSYWSRGSCYEGWCPNFKEKDERVCRRISKNYPIIDLEWGREKAPILIQYYLKPHDKVKKIWFDHSLEGMEQALKSAESLLKK